VSGFSRTFVALLLAAPTVAQTLEFEVATIKPNNSGSRNSGSSTPAVGRFQGNNLTLRQLVVRAHSVRDFQVVGGPDWMREERYDVIGKPPDTAPPNSSLEMLRALLAQRFTLVVHKEMREQPIYALVLARADGKLGPAMSAVDCEHEQKNCGNTSTNESNGVGTVKATGQTMDGLAIWASDRVDRVVVDRTGLKGTFNFELKYASVRASQLSADAPSIFTALQEQLGLKLEGARGPVEFIVVDRAERPTPD
jgi:uncharacterized protein (TIGR03435 family)